MTTTITTPHEYLSTACFHGEHDYCNAMTGYNGRKRPAQCKFCETKCTCSCHIDLSIKESNG